MVGIRAVTILAGVASFGVFSAASADPVTFAQVTELNNANGLTWTNNGTSSTLNTTNTAGDFVNFTFQNITGLNGTLAGTVSALETINGGAGATTTAAAVSFGGLLYQAITSPITISYSLLTPIGGLSNLLTITIAPLTATSGGLAVTGQAGSSGASLFASYPPIGSYTETFSSDFVSSFEDPITASYSLSALFPLMTVGAGGMLSSFTADATGTFSSAIAPVVVTEPASLAILAVGLVGIGFATRRRRGFSVA